ncbi:hypothetical protein PR048_020218 [Dryococelus australis]|uniref:Uncharacterized protein n=1 Tax=Dryococelus australis TaxID=614101 RepID=A0ABQ9H5T5_9NEOP|nr:hypothetical protein PR048_020218 [Dryococelus australis]
MKQELKTALIIPPNDFSSTGAVYIFSEDPNELVDTGDPRENHRPSASSDTIPTCENPGLTLRGVEPDLLCWEANRLIALPPKTLNSHTCSCKITNFILNLKQHRRNNSSTVSLLRYSIYRFVEFTT